MLRWHGRTGRSAGADRAASVQQYSVVLEGTPLDGDDAATVHARLSQDGWALELVSSVIVHGIWPGRGQLWPPDPQARVSLQAGAPDVAGRIQQRRLQVYSCLPREEVRYRLLIALSEDRLVAVELLPESD